MNTKRILAVALSATMVFGSTLTAFADDPDTSAATGTGSGTGTSTSEGYVDTMVSKVLVPTEQTVKEGLSFHVDPQRLISGTSKAAHPDWTMPEAAGDTGVYFLTGDKTYTNTSSTFDIANIGTKDVTFTIKVEAAASETPDKDIPFDSKTNVEAANPTAAKLYIGAKIGKGATAEAVSSEALTKKVVLAGNPANYDYNSGAKGYEYVMKSGELEWNAVPVSFEGSITNFATDKTVPGIKLTYSWAAKADDDATSEGVTIEDKFVPSEDELAGGESTPVISNATKVTGQAWNYTATFTKGSALTMAATGLTEATWSKTVDSGYAASSNITVSNGAVTIAASNWGSANSGDVRYIKVKISGTDYIIKITIA